MNFYSRANPSRETAFYSPSTQKATLCLLSYIALLAPFSSSLFCKTAAAMTFCLNPPFHFQQTTSLYKAFLFCKPNKGS